MAPWSTGKGGQCVGLTTLRVLIVMKSGSLNLWNPQGQYRDSLLLLLLLLLLLFTAIGVFTRCQ